MLVEHPIYDELARAHQYDGGWAFEDGGHNGCTHTWEETVCDCPRPWSHAWDLFCDAPYAVGYRDYDKEFDIIRQLTLNCVKPSTWTSRNSTD